MRWSRQEAFYVSYFWVVIKIRHGWNVNLLKACALLFRAKALIEQHSYYAEWQLHILPVGFCSEKSMLSNGNPREDYAIIKNDWDGWPWPSLSAEGKILKQIVAVFEISQCCWGLCSCSFFYAGEIPSTMGNLSALLKVSLSFNKLSGGGGGRQYYGRTMRLDLGPDYPDSVPIYCTSYALRQSLCWLCYSSSPYMSWWQNTFSMVHVSPIQLYGLREAMGVLWAW